MFRYLFFCVLLAYHSQGATGCAMMGCIRSVSSFMASGVTKNRGASCSTEEKRLKAAAVGCLSSFKDGSMDLAGCPQNARQMLSARVGPLIDSISILCSDCPLMTIRTRCQTKIIKGKYLGKGRSVAMEALFSCLRNEAKSIPGCNTPSAKAGIERIISITRQHLAGALEAPVHRTSAFRQAGKRERCTVDYVNKQGFPFVTTLFGIQYLGNMETFFKTRKYHEHRTRHS